VTIKGLLFCLFLYVCLVWVGVAYLYSGSPADFRHYGLLWTAIGLIALLALVIGSRLISWWRIARARAAARPQAPAKPPAPINPEDEALTALLAEANTTLAKSPAFAGKRGGTPLASLPWYLLVGPEGTGKTSTLVNSGLEPILLAGQVSGNAPVIATRMCNLWLAKGAVFAELGGRAFSGDPGRWSQLLRILRGNAKVPLWRRVWGDPAPQTDLRGVIAFCNCSELTGATSDPQRLERLSSEWQERLGAIAEVFDLEVPVYLVIAKCDKIRFFSDFFRRLPDSEAGQVLGCTLAPREAGKTEPGEVFAEVEAKRLIASFRPLYHALAERRLTQLANEPDPRQRPSIYEFPRELKRIRSPLVQFLTDVFRTRSLGPKPVLRGYYLTAVREVQMEGDSGPVRLKNATPVPMDATRLFRPDATQLLPGDDMTSGPAVAARRSPGFAWMFVADLFHRVILRDQLPQKFQTVSGHLDRIHTWSFRAVSVLCAVLCLVFFVSWLGNRELLSEVRAASIGAPTGGRSNLATVADLRSLDTLRGQIVKLEGSSPLSLHWGLYSGDRVLPAVRALYYRRFRDLLLIDLNSVMLADLEALPGAPGEGALAEPAYHTLKAHLMVSAGGCPVDSAFLSRSLKEFRPRIAGGATVEWQALADRQIDFYANESRYDEPPRLPEDAAGREHARQYLLKIKGGIDRLYASILASTKKNVGKTARLAELAPNYAQVLTGPDDVDGAFTPAGWNLVEKASKESNAPTAGEPCVVGENPGAVTTWKQNAETAQSVQRMYLRDYAESWRKYLEGFSVIRYTSPEDAARKLEILRDHNSPLLALLYLTANQTNLPTPPGPVESAIENVPVLNKLVTPAKKAEGQVKALVPVTGAEDGFKSPADIAAFFQPVHSVEPPGATTWVGEKTAPYVEALAQLHRSMQDIAQSGDKDPAIHQTASQNYEKALDTVRVITQDFHPVGVGTLDVTVKRLLESPILSAKPFINSDPDKVKVTKANRDLNTFCTSQRTTFTKFPFQPSNNNNEVTPEEFKNAFDPVKGAFWKFQQQSLAEYVVKEGTQWRPKDPAQKPRIASDMLTYLNHAQQIRDAFWASGQLGFTFILRPKPDPRWKNAALELKVDGQPFQWDSLMLQHSFTWPARPGAPDVGVVATMRIPDTPAAPFTAEGGFWGIFRIMADAEPREEGDGLVVWKYSGRGRRELMGAPVQVEIVGFPGGADIFNPKFWEHLRCPKVAVQ
jgi:type VI secretion system protein ImpL